MNRKELQFGAYVRKALPLQASWASPDDVENKWMLTGKGAGPFDAFMIKANNPERVVRYVASSAITDYDDERMAISKTAPRLKNFLNHRACLWAHIYYEPVIANVIRAKKDLEAELLMLWLEFLPREVYEEADNKFKIIKHQQSDGVSAMPNGSIGFKYYAGELGTMEDDGYLFRFTDWELLEFSPCPVGSNPDAHGYLPTDETGKKKFWGGYSPGVWPTKIVVNPQELDYQTIMKNLPIIGQSKSEDDEITKPYPNEHSCRLADPKDFERFARKNCDRKHDGKCIDVIYGIKDNKSSAQALRFKTDIWTEDAAKSYCKDQGGSFEAAEEEEKTVEQAVQRIETNTEAIKHFIGTEIIPRLDRIEKSMGPAKPPEASKAPAPNDKIATTHRRIAKLFGNGVSPKPESKADDLSDSFKKAKPKLDKEGESNG